MYDTTPWTAGVLLYFVIVLTILQKFCKAVYRMKVTSTTFWSPSIAFFLHFWNIRTVLIL